jgi:HK97 family phage major capsid protein
MAENKLKKLIEKRNAAKKEANELINKVVVTETRSMDEAETTRMKALNDEIRSIDQTIAVVNEQLKTVDTVEFVKDKKEQRNAKDLDAEAEVRGFEQYLRQQDGEEVRALTAQQSGDSSNGGGVLVPTTIYGQIIQKVTESAPIFAAANRINATGDIKVVREDEDGDAQTPVQGAWIGELTDAADTAPKFKFVTLKQRRVAASLQLSNQAINDAQFDVINYSIAYLAGRIAKCLEDAILNGNGDTGDTFSGVLNDADIESITVDGEQLIEAIMDIYAGINPVYLTGSMWVTDRATFNRLMKLRDGDGSYLVLRSIVGKVPGYQLFGCTLYVSDRMPANTVLFGNFAQGYMISIKKDMALTQVSHDSAQALKGGNLLVLDGYMDGIVVNPKVFVKSNVANTVQTHLLTQDADGSSATTTTSTIGG